MKRWIFLLTFGLVTSTFAQATFPKIEASFTVNSLGSANPYDFTVVDIRVNLSQPNGSILSLPAFYDGATTWRVRHTPTMTGVYAVQGVTLNGQALSVAKLQPAYWDVTGAPTSRGFVRLDPSNAQRFITGNGQRYFPMGHDAAWDIDGTRTVVSIMSKMGGTRETFSRIWMDDWDGKNLDWPLNGTPLGKLNLSVAQKWDAIVEAADQAGVQFQMTLQHHGQYSTTVDPEWSSNPYNVTQGGFLSDATQFFTNATAIKYTQQKFRYSVARWGYSPAILAWELFNEVQFTDAGQDNDWGIIESWHNQMAAFLRAQDSYHHLITTSSVLNEPIWDSTDYYTHHDYPNDLIDGIWDAPTITASQPVAPVFGSECGIDFTPHLGETPTAFSGLLAGQSGAEQIWYWDVIDTNNDYVAMLSAADFATFSGLGAQPDLVKSQPAITTSAYGPLIFSPGGGYSDATQSVFTVGPEAPDGIGSLPSYLQGEYHNSMTPDGYTFLVNYPEAGTFSVQVIQVASSGAGLTVHLDNLTTNVVFPSAGSDTSTNFVLTLNVSAGAHTIVLTNGGLDWINLGNLTFDPYAPIVGAFELSNPQFAACWLWNRTNIYNPAATATVSAQVALGNLDAGEYTGVWWDAARGVVISNFSYTAAGNAPVSVTTPPFLRSIALYVGLAPSAQISAPALTQTLGTNAPWLTLPLTIANSGVLPLSYSLSVTNVSPIVYRSITSQQPGGPWFAWKDISGTGADVVTNLTALTSKSAKDEGIAGPINLGFNFPFYSGGQTPGSYAQIYVSPNGFLTFSPFTGDTSVNKTFPSATAPSNCVALYWCDLKAGSASHIYAAPDPVGKTFTIQFQNMTPNSTGGGAITGQIILKSTGEIVLQYQSIGGQTNVTVGVQNAAASQGLTVATNAAGLQTSAAILISPTPWLRVGPSGGLVNGSFSSSVDVSFNSLGLAPGSYSATLNVNTSDPNLPVQSFPVALNVSPSLPAAPSFLSAESITWSHVTVTWTNDAGNQSGFQIWRATSPGGPYVLAGVAAANATSFTDTNDTSQTTYYYEVVATNAAGASLSSDPVGAVTPLAPVDLWRQTYFGTTVNAGTAADGADPTHDGLVNLEAYAFADNPTTTNAFPLTFALTNGQLAVTFKRPDPPPLDVNYIIQTTTDLSTPWAASGAVQSIQSNGNGTENVTLIAPHSSQAYFLRVSVARQ